MGELGEYYQEKRAADQTAKAKRLKWNTDVVFGLCEEYGYKVIQHEVWHLSLIHPVKGRMDFWPTVNKILWWGKKKRPTGKATVIKDIEKYLMNHFKPQNDKLTI